MCGMDNIISELLNEGFVFQKNFTFFDTERLRQRIKYSKISEDPNTSNDVVNYFNEYGSTVSQMIDNTNSDLYADAKNPSKLAKGILSGILLINGILILNGMKAKKDDLILLNLICIVLCAIVGFILLMSRTHDKRTIYDNIKFLSEVKEKLKLINNSCPNDEIKKQTQLIIDKIDSIETHKYDLNVSENDSSTDYIDIFKTLFKKFKF